MDNSINPFNPQPNNSPQSNKDFPPAMDSQEEQSFQQSQQGRQDQQSQQFQPSQSIDSTPQATVPLNTKGPILNNTGVNLGSPILAPSHFDNLKDPNLQPQQQAFGSATAQKQDLASKAKTYMILSVIFGVLAFIGILVGVWSLVSNVSTSSQLAAAESALKITDGIIKKVEQETGKTITSIEDVPEYNPVTGYIYITEWGIKFKIPEDIVDVSYTLDQKYRPQICFTGYKTGIKYFPGFADIDKNPNGLGCVTRVATYEGDIDKDTGKSFGQKIYTYDDYNYFYSAPETHFSQDQAEQGLEDTAVQIIKNMIANNISHYE